MRFSIRWILTVGGALAVGCACAAVEELPLEQGWSRTAGTSSAEVDLPDDFRMNLPWEESVGGNAGYKPFTNCTYETTFTVPESWRGKRVFLDLDGVQSFSDVFLNDRHVGSNEYGSLGFELEITQQIRPGAENKVRVACFTGGYRTCRWYTGCGITRGVRVVVREKTAFLRHGLCVTTPTAGPARADVRLSADVDGWPIDATGRLEVVGRILDAQGREVARSGCSVRPTRNAFATAELPLVAVERPHRWDLDDPYLYRAEVRLLRDGREVDRLTERFGIREIAYGPDFGFRLNGRKVFLKGMSNHQHLGALGEASYRRAWRRQLLTMREFGFNALRCAHNPYPEELLGLCDEMGILVVDELVDKWGRFWPGRKPFMELAPQLVREWVRRGRNHPSVILWSVGNETQFAADGDLPFGDGNHGITEYRVLDALVKRWDSTRPTTVAMFPARSDDRTRRDADFWTDRTPPELSTVTEVASYNYVPGDYAEYRRLFPHLIVFQSEAAVKALTYALYVMDPVTSVGLSYWGAIEYWGESDGWPKKGWDYSFFRRTLDPHPQAWLVRSAFRDVTEEPVVKIGVETDAPVRRHWNDVDVGTLRLAETWNAAPGSTRRVFVFTNADAVDLRLNGRSLGVRANDRADPARRNVLEWPAVAWEAGVLEAVATVAGREVARTRIETTGPAVALRMVCENASDWQADGRDLQYVRVYAVDSAGRRVREAKGRVTFSVEGEATFLAADDGDSNTSRRFDDPSVGLHAGMALGIFRATRHAGHVRVTADGGPLGRSSVDLETARRP